MKSQLQKRVESLLWRAGMMGVAIFIATLSEGISGVGLPVGYIGILGLLLGEASKWVYNIARGEV